MSELSICFRHHFPKINRTIYLIDKTFKNEGLKSFEIMDEYDLEGDTGEESEAESGDEVEVSSEEEAFLQGYNEDEKVHICEECGSALREGKKSFHKEINGEDHTFCSKSCAEEFEETMKTE